VQLYEQGLIYRGKPARQLDPKLQTAVSDLEVETEEEDGRLWKSAIRRWTAGKASSCDDAPETLLGDVAVAVHPEDERYTALVGRQVTLR